MHGDGLTKRVVVWPVVDDDGALSLVWLIAVGRRFRCPTCRSTVRVAHPGLRRGATYAVAAVAALLRIVAPSPVGQGLCDAVAYELARDDALPVSERARSGRPRWSSLRRWGRALHVLWPTVPLPTGRRDVQLQALFAAFGVGAPLMEVLATAVEVHARGGAAM